MEYRQGNKINKVPNTQKEATSFSVSSAEHLRDDHAICN